MPQDSQFCVQCGAAVIALSVISASSPRAATGVAPALEPSESRKIQGESIALFSDPSTTPARVIESPPPVDPVNGVRGWLLFFCLSLVVVQPIALLLEAINGGDALVATFNLLLGISAVSTGVALWRVASSALKLVKAYFVVMLVLGVLAIVGSIATTSAIPSHSQPQDNLLTAGSRMLIGVAIWWNYFRKSKRVRATYGANL